MKRISKHLVQRISALSAFCLIWMVSTLDSQAAAPVDKRDLDAKKVDAALDRAMRRDDGLYVVGLYERTWRKYDPDGSANPVAGVIGLLLAIPTLGQSLCMIPDDVPPSWVQNDVCAFYTVDGREEAEALIRRFMIDTRPTSPHIRVWQIHGRYSVDKKAAKRELGLQRTYARHLIPEQRIELMQTMFR